MERENPKAALTRRSSSRLVLNEDTVEDTSKRAPAGRKAGAKNYTPEDIDALLTLVDRLIPTTPEEWNNLATKFNLWTSSNRQADGLKRKFDAIVRSRASVPMKAEQPDYALKARKLNRKLQQKSLLTASSSNPSTSTPTIPFGTGEIALEQENELVMENEQVVSTKRYRTPAAASAQLHAAEERMTEVLSRLNHLEERTRLTEAQSTQSSKRQQNHIDQLQSQANQLQTDLSCLRQLQTQMQQQMQREMFQLRQQLHTLTASVLKTAPSVNTSIVNDSTHIEEDPVI